MEVDRTASRHQPSGHTAMYARRDPGRWADRPTTAGLGLRTGPSAQAQPGGRLRQLPAGADTELSEHLVQVPFHGACAEEQLRPDLGVGQAPAREAGDLDLLRREVLGRLHVPLARGGASGKELAAGALGEGVHAQATERLVGDVQLCPGIDAPAAPSEPLAVEQVCAAEL